MKCKNCGEWLPEGVAMCAACGTKLENYDHIMNENIERFGMEKCQKCGYIGSPVKEKMMRKIDWALLVLSVFTGGWTLIYLIYLWFKRGDASKRDEVCPSCGAVMNKATNNGMLGADDAINKVKAVAMNPDVQKAVIKGAKDLKKSAKQFSNSLDPF